MRRSLLVLGVVTLSLFLPAPGPPDRVAASSFDFWGFWWAYHREEFLPDPGIRPEVELAARERIAPALRRALLDEKLHDDIRGSAAIGLARCPGSRANLDALFEIGASSRQRRFDTMREAAVLGVAIAQPRTARAREFLTAILEADTESVRLRCFAAVALGLLPGRAKEVSAALRAMARSETCPDELTVCSLFGLGLTRDKNNVPVLLGWLDQGRIGTKPLTDVTRANVLTALGKLGDARALWPVLAALGSGGLYPRRSAALALGRILPPAPAPDQAAALERIRKRIREETDEATVRFTAMSLGRIAGDPTASGAVRTGALETVEAMFQRAGPNHHRPYLALALGLAGGDRTEAERHRLADLVKSAAEKRADSPTNRAALLVALGMLRDDREETTNYLCVILCDRTRTEAKHHRTRFRFSAATAIGLSGAEDGWPAIESVLGETDDRDFQIQVAHAAGMLGRREVVDTLLSRFSVPDQTQFVLGSTALALGEVGDERAIGPLLEILEVDKRAGRYPELTRALATVALGRIACGGRPRVISRMGFDVNYRGATVPALEELLTIL